MRRTQARGSDTSLGSRRAWSRSVTLAERDDAPPGLVSVVVPVRDGAATIGAQLDALARQRGARAYEVVVADNSSSDGTRDVVLAHRGSSAR